MVENSSSRMFLPIKFGCSFILVLCLAVPSSRATSMQANITQESLAEDGFIQDEMEGFQNISIVQGEEFGNTTEHKGFLHGFVESLSVILVSELGDKTFFIAAILAMQNNKLLVFLAAIGALAVMTVLSALLGFVVTTFIPREYTYYACTAIMFLFGFKMLWEAWRMSDTELEDTQREVEEEIARRGSISSSNPGVTAADAEAAVPMTEAGQEAEVDTDASTEVKEKKKSMREQIRENSWFGKKCLKIFKVFTNTFGMTFLAEWGDRSQLATIVMAGINDVAGVCVGGVLGHFICTGLAVLCGALIAKKISVRKVTALGALVFIGFAIASLFIDPNEESHLVPDVEGDNHNATIYKENHISFVETTTSRVATRHAD
ncbi:transmembrane protein 165 [Eurytemora carolleeae]|uniref:transmembrane protein 165 n=1 Tax=Eurytemora carolleeae TaxID=1294199 RepID=UPI000C790408|nr:transmembrane protein 165 [Eurytemora carolleeae]|eukprot:XP_023344409.1 transmembrane protein 165-like [Eurytemora affinis]